MSAQETPEAVATAPPTVDAVVEKYIQLRDRKGELKKKFDQSVEAIDAAMERCEAFLKRHLDSQGLESAKTAAGTVYLTTRTSATVSDKESFLNYVRNHDEWAMLDVRANKTVIADFVEQNKDLPPGVNWSAIRAVNVRR